MAPLPFALDILAQGAWNGGERIGNAAYAGRGMVFKGGIPVTEETIEERIGVRTRVAAPEDVRIGAIALEELLARPAVDPARIRVLIAATNIGEDKFDPGPASRALLERLAPLDEPSRGLDEPRSRQGAEHAGAELLDQDDHVARGMVGQHADR